MAKTKGFQATISALKAHVSAIRRLLLRATEN
jgi:hypothetical protein